MGKDDIPYTFAKLSGSASYKKWSREMTFALQEAELWGYITGDRIKPRELIEKKDDNEDRLEKIDQRKLDRLEFDEKERRVVGKIGKMCTDDVQQEFLAMKDVSKKESWTPKELWEHLKTRYTLKNWSAKWSAFNRLEELDYSRCKSIEEYGSNARDILAELTDMTLSIEQVVLLKLLNGLGSSFSTYLTILNEQARRDKSFPKLDELLKNLEDEESRVRQDAVSIANVISRAKKVDQSTNLSEADKKELCLCCGKWHRGECRFIKAKCNTCNEIGHISRVCKNVPKEGKNEQKQTMMCMLTGLNEMAPIKGSSPIINSINVGSNSGSDDLLLDSGTTDHSVCNLNLFMAGTYKEESSYLETGSGERILSEGIGSVLVPLRNGNGYQTDLILTRVRYSSALRYNLISTRRLGRDGIETRLRTYGQPSELIYKETVLGFADSINQQYHIRVSPPDKSQTFVTSSKKTDSYAIWHERLGHLSYTSMAKLLDLSTGLNLSDTPPKEICGPCMKGRQRRNINRMERTRATKFLGIVHSDVGGPFPPTLYGEKYYSLFKDDSTGVCWIYLMKTKGEVPAKFRLFRSWAENQSGCKLKVLRADGGGEYMSTEFQEELKETGVEWQPRSPYVPEQNGKAERQNYTLMASVRSVMAAKNLPRFLWGEILKTSAYLKNRSPGPDPETPYERLNHGKPNLSHLKVLGARAWVHVPEEVRTGKLADWSWEGIFVGYDGTNQFRVYNPRTRKIHVARDVDIDEVSVGLTSASYSDNTPTWSQDDDALFGDRDETTYDNPSFNGTPLKETVGDISNDQQDLENASRQLNEGEELENTDDESILSEPDTDVDTNLKEMENSGTNQNIRRSTRTRIPTKPAEGVIRYDANKTLPKANLLTSKFSASQVPKSHQHMVKVLAMLAEGSDTTDSDEPSSLKEAMKRPDWQNWKNAMSVEYSSLMENETWSLVDSPNGRKVISGRWVFKLKKDREGKILKYKARWVVHGYKQQEGLDYVDTFATVVKPVSYKALFGIGVKRGLTIRHMDVVTAFLYGFLDEAIYIIQPTLFEVKGLQDLVCLLRKALYGLKQAPRVWYQTLADFLEKKGFRRTESDHGVFVSEHMFIAIYVDDLLIMSKVNSELDALQDQLKARFKMTDLGEVSHYLGMQVDINSDKSEITLRQTTYLKKVLERFHLQDCKPVSTPMEPGIGNLLLPSEEQADKETIKWYQSIVGSLMWPAIHTRPDLAYSVGVLSRYCSNPGKLHCNLLQRVLRYVAGTLNLGLVFRKDSEDDIVGYSDSDYAGLIDGRKSTGAYVFMFAGGPISHSSKLQPTVSLSSCEAEYMALVETAKEAVWCARFLAELGYRKGESPVLLRADNQGSISLSKNPEFHKRTKHIEIKWHWIREVVESGRIKIEYISTKSMIADGLTKPLNGQLFKDFKIMMGMRTVNMRQRSHDS